MGRKVKSDSERFFALTIPITESGCLIWLAQCHKGYGIFCYKGREIASHRFAWQLTHGPIPQGLCVCHHCDVSICVNVNHLFIGTHRDNMEDAAKKGFLKGRKFSIDHKINLSKAMKGHKVSQETRAKISNSLTKGPRPTTIELCKDGILPQHRATN